MGYCRWSRSATATYPTLSAICGTTYNTADGQSAPGAGLFRIPKMAGRTALGVGTSGTATGATAHTLGQYGGEEKHTLSAGEMPVHSHSISDPSHAHSVYDPGHSHGGQTDGIPDFSMSIGGGGVGMLSDNPGAPYRLYLAIGTDGRGTGIGIYGAYTGITGTNNAGSGTNHNVLSPYVGLNYIIRIS